MSVIIKSYKLIFVGFLLLQSVIHCQVIPVGKSLISRDNEDFSSISYSDSSSEILPSYLPIQSFPSSNTILRKQLSRQKRHGLGLLPTEEENGEFVCFYFVLIFGPFIVKYDSQCFSLCT